EQRALTHSRSGESRFWETRAGTPAGRLVEPSDVADAVCFLCSPAAEMVRGQTLVVDGGFSLLASTKVLRLLGRRQRCGAGGHSVRNTGPESTVPPAASAGGRAGLCPAS